MDDVECINGCNQQHVYIYCMVCKYEWYKRWKWKKEYVNVSVTINNVQKYDVNEKVKCYDLFGEQAIP